MDGGEKVVVFIQHLGLDIMHDAAVNHQKEVRGKGAALPDA